MFSQRKYVSATISFPYHHLQTAQLNPDALARVVRGKYFAPQLLQGSDGSSAWVFVSEHGNSRIVLAPITVELSVRFTLDWQVSPQLGKDYLKERIRLLLSLLEAVQRDEQTAYVGVTLKGLLVSTSDDLDTVSRIAKTCGIDDTSELFDIVSKISRVIEDTYYMNIQVHNYRIWSPETQIAPLVRLSNGDAVERGAEVNIDFNSRHAFNEGRSNEIAEDVISEMVDKAYDALGTVFHRLEEGRPWTH